MLAMPCVLCTAVQALNGRQVEDILEAAMVYRVTSHTAGEEGWGGYGREGGAELTLHHLHKVIMQCWRPQSAQQEKNAVARAVEQQGAVRVGMHSNIVYRLVRVYLRCEDEQLVQASCLCHQCCTDMMRSSPCALVYANVLSSAVHLNITDNWCHVKA